MYHASVAVANFQSTAGCGSYATIAAIAFVLHASISTKVTTIQLAVISAANVSMVF